MFSMQMYKGEFFIANFIQNLKNLPSASYFNQLTSNF